MGGDEKLKETAVAGSVPDAVAEFAARRRRWFATNGVGGEERCVRDRDGRTTWLLDTGGEAVPTVLVHGGISEASVWGLVAGRLPGRVVLVDRPGCGLSDPIDYSRVPDYRRHAADWLTDVLDALGAERANLVGNSMGGYFSMALATAHPERVERLLLVGAPAGLDRRIPLFLRLWGSPVIGSLISRMRFTDLEQFRTRVWTDLVARPEDLPTEFLEVALASADVPGAARTTQTMMASVSTLGGWRPRLAMREPMADLAVPTLFLWGDQDAFAAPASGQELASRMPAAELSVLPGVGHIPQLDAPDAVVAAATDFLGQRIEPGR